VFVEATDLESSVLPITPRGKFLLL